jgi:putative FmdB family regulatory protein
MASYEGVGADPARACEELERNSGCGGRLVSTSSTSGSLDLRARSTSALLSGRSREYQDLAYHWHSRGLSASASTLASVLRPKERPVPTYQYSCTECGHFFEAVQSFSDDSLTVCPECDGRLRKVFNAVGVVFKGSGFYRTDSRSSSTAAEPGATKTETKSESKTESTTATKSESKAPAAAAAD